MSEICRSKNTKALRGAVAIKAVGPGEMIGFLPPGLILSESTGLASPFGQMLNNYLLNNPDETLAVTGSTDLYAKPSIQFAAFIAHELQFNKDSFWCPYFETLPADFGLPLQWPQKDIDLFLEGTNLEFMAKERRRMLEDAVRLIRRAAQSTKGFEYCSDLSFDSLAWAYSAIISRAFPKGKSIIVDGSLDTQTAASAGVEDGEVATRQKGYGQNDPKALFELCLYPVLDMINHKRGQEIEWNSQITPGITFISPLGIQAGEVIWNNCSIQMDPKGNENLLSNYGFVLDPNPEDYAKIALNISPQDPLHEYRKSILNLHRAVSTVHLFFEDDRKIADDLMSATRILVGSELEVEQVVASLEGDVSKGTAKLDLVALSTLFGLISGKVQKLEDRKRKLDGFTCVSDSQRERLAMANTYREGQIRIFRHTLSLVQQAFARILSKDGISSASQLLTLRNSSQSGQVLEAIAEDLNSIDDEGLLDQDTILALILMHEEFLGSESEFRGFFVGESGGRRSVDEALAILGDQANEMIDFYNQALNPFLQKSAFFRELSHQQDTPAAAFSASRFVWAHSFLQTHGINLSVSVLSAMDLLDLFQDEVEGGDEQEDLFGVVML
ncbi:hypothetical protein BDR26DRAFT_825686 [Obelidium mucronatum]|nr:hypothetical protein BDR26DRAFT_825686 [Obelidium mucronatum]